MVIKLTYSVQQLWKRNGVFYEFIKDLILSGLGEISKNNQVGFNNLEITQEDLEFYCDNYSDAKGNTYGFWGVLEAVSKMCMASWAAERESFGKEVSMLSSDGIEVYVKSNATLLSATVNDVFHGGRVEDENGIRYLTFEEWNVNGAPLHQDANVYFSLRDNNRRPSLAFCIGFLQWARMIDPSVKLLTREQYVKNN